MSAPSASRVEAFRCPTCRSGAGEKCLDLRALRTGRYVANKHPHAKRVARARVWER